MIFKLIDHANKKRRGFLVRKDVDKPLNSWANGRFWVVLKNCVKNVQKVTLG